MFQERIENILEEKLYYSYTSSKFLLVVIQKLLTFYELLVYKGWKTPKQIPKTIMSATLLKGSPLHPRPNHTKDALYSTSGSGKKAKFY